MALFTLEKIDKFSAIALVLIASAVPVFAVSSYEGTVETSIGRWLALYLIGAEAAVVVLAFFSGLQPVTDWKRLPASVRIAISLWAIIASIATAYSSDVNYSGTFQAFWVIHGLFAWALWSMLTTNWRSIQFSLLVYFSIGLLLHSIGVYFVAWAVLGPNLEDWERYSFGTTNPRLYIFYADALLGLGLGFLIAARDRATWLLAIILTFAAYHLFAWSGGRASFGTSLVMPFLLIILARNQWKRILAVAVPCAVVAFPLSLLTAPANYLYGFKSVIGRIGGGALDNEYSSNRFEIWTEMLAQSLERPIFGHGQVGTLDLTHQQAPGAVLNAHNAIVHIIHAWGGLGLLAFAIGLLPFISTIRKRLEAQPMVAWPAFATLLALAVSSALDGTLFYNQPLFFSALFIAILASVPATTCQQPSVRS